MFRKFVFAPRTRRTRGAGYTVVREDGSAQDSARANTPDWRDGIGALQHLCRSAVVWPDARWVDHDAAAPSLPVQRVYRYRRTFVAGIFFYTALCPGKQWSVWCSC